MRRIAYFTTKTKEEFEIPDFEGIVIYIFYIKSIDDVDYFLEIMDITEYVIDATLEELLERLCL